MRGGGVRASKTQTQHVMIIDFPTWLELNFDAEDFVVIKMDVEGAEHQILPRRFQPVRCQPKKQSEREGGGGVRNGMCETPFG